MLNRMCLIAVPIYNDCSFIENFISLIQAQTYKIKSQLKEELDSLEIYTLPVQYGLTFIRKVAGDWRNG